METVRGVPSTAHTHVTPWHLELPCCTGAWPSRCTKEPAKGGVAMRTFRKAKSSNRKQRRTEGLTKVTFTELGPDDILTVFGGEGPDDILAASGGDEKPK